MSIEFAKNELKLLEKGCRSEDELAMQEEATRNVLELLEVFRKQEHSGFSASYTINILKRLVDNKPLSPLTGEDDEWGDSLTLGDVQTQQNKRCSSVFRDNFDNSTAHDIYDIAFSDNGGITWFGSEAKARIYRKPIQFPWMPPSEPRKIYIKYVEDVPPGETSDNFIDITDNPEEIKRLRKKFQDLKDK